MEEILDEFLFEDPSSLPQNNLIWFEVQEIFPDLRCPPGDLFQIFPQLQLVDDLGVHGESQYFIDQKYRTSTPLHGLQTGTWLYKFPEQKKRSRNNRELSLASLQWISSKRSKPQCLVESNCFRVGIPSPRDAQSPGGHQHLGRDEALSWWLSQSFLIHY